MPSSVSCSVRSREEHASNYKPIPPRNMEKNLGENRLLCYSIYSTPSSAGPKLGSWKIYYLYVINFPVNSKWVLEYWLILYVSRAFIWATTCYIFINISVSNLGWVYSAVKIRLRLRLKLWLRLRHISDSGRTLFILLNDNSQPLLYIMFYQATMYSTLA